MFEVVIILIIIINFAPFFAVRVLMSSAPSGTTTTRSTKAKARETKMKVHAMLQILLCYYSSSRLGMFTCCFCLQVHALLDIYVSAHRVSHFCATMILIYSSRRWTAPAEQSRRRLRLKTLNTVYHHSWYECWLFWFLSSSLSIISIIS